MKKPILCAGRLYCDLVFSGAHRLPTPGTEVFAPGVSLHAGGGAFITGANLVSLGHSAYQFSTLPAAPFDAIVLADLELYGIDASACVGAIEGIDPQITVAIACGDDRAFLTRKDGPAVPDPASVDFVGFSHLHIGELRTLQEMPQLLEQARSTGLTVSLDCGWQDDFECSAADLIKAVDVFLPNESEAAALRAVGVPEVCAPLTVIKNGKSGARARRLNDEVWTHATAKPVDVLDATGAGDSFNAGFLSCWLANASLGQCLSQGNACGAAAVQALGGAGYLKERLSA